MNCAIAHLSLHPAIEARPLWPDGKQPSRKTAQRLCDLAAMATAATFGLPVGEIVAATTRRTPYVAFARQGAMYVAHVTFGLSYSEVGRAFGRDSTTAAYACRLIEDRRDDPAVDAVLYLLESVCASLRLRLAAPVRP